MLVAIEVISVFLVALAMSLALAHTLEFPGKLRLDREAYLTVQTVYYPGFTLAGAGEPLAILSTLILLWMMRGRGTTFWLVLVSFLGVLLMQAVFWLVTQPTNRYWLKNQRLTKAGSKFFGVEQREQSKRESTPDWSAFRNRWEYSHIIRSVLSMISLLTLTVAIVS
jgi:anthrone oxygenase-like protein